MKKIGQFVGYTVDVDKNLDSDKFEFYNYFDDKNPEYRYDGKNPIGKVLFIIDGYNGDFARIIKVLDYKEPCIENMSQYKYSKYINEVYKCLIQ